MLLVSQFSPKVKRWYRKPILSLRDTVLNFACVAKCLKCLSELSASTYWDDGIWIQAGKWNEKWMAISFCFFMVPNMSSIQGDKEFSRASEPCKRWHISLCQPLINCLALLIKVMDMLLKAWRLRKSHRTALSPNSKLYPGERGMLSIVGVSGFHPSEGVGKAYIFKWS